MKAGANDKKVGRKFRSQPDDSSEVIRRWQQLQVICAKPGKYRRSMSENIAFQWQDNLTRNMQLIWTLSSLVTLFIVGRIGLKLITSDIGTPLGRFVVTLTDMLLQPFSGATETLTTTHINVLELSALNALIIYPFAAWCVVKLLQFLYTPSR